MCKTNFKQITNNSIISWSISGQTNNLALLLWQSLVLLPVVAKCRWLEDGALCMSLSLREVWGTAPAARAAPVLHWRKSPTEGQTGSIQHPPLSQTHSATGYRQRERNCIAFNVFPLSAGFTEVLCPGSLILTAAWTEPVRRNFISSRT